MTNIAPPGKLILFSMKRKTKNWFGLCKNGNLSSSDGKILRRKLSTASKLCTTFTFQKDSWPLPSNKIAAEHCMYTRKINLDQYAHRSLSAFTFTKKTDDYFLSDRPPFSFECTTFSLMIINNWKTSCSTLSLVIQSPSTSFFYDPAGRAFDHRANVKKRI